MDIRPLTPTNVSFGERIREQVLSVIKTRKLNDRLPTEVELAKAFGVNRLTVHKVMAELGREGYVERVPGRGTFVANPERRVVLGLDNLRKLNEIVIAYADYYSYDLWRKVQCSEDFARKHEVELINVKMTPATKYQNVVDLIRSRRAQVKGAIILPPTTIERKSLTAMDSLGIPMVVLAATSDAGLGRNFRRIYYDAFKAGYLAAMHLFQRGHRKLAYIQNEPWNAASKLHYNGVKAALYEKKFNLRDLIRGPLGIEPWSDSFESGYRFTTEILKSKPTAIIYRSFPGAIGALRAIAEAGLRCPDDISIVTQGETGPLDAYLVPRITSVVADYSAWVGAAFDAILGSEERKGRQIIIDVKLVEGGSVRTMPAADPEMRGGK